MKKEQKHGGLHITFHDPNNPDELAKHLIRMIASDLASKAACVSAQRAGPAAGSAAMSDEAQWDQAI